MASDAGRPLQETVTISFDPLVEVEDRMGKPVPYGPRTIGEGVRFMAKFPIPRGKVTEAGEKSSVVVICTGYIPKAALSIPVVQFVATAMGMVLASKL
jgi:hypothetical protein